MTKKQNKAGIAALMLAVLFLILAIPAFADEGALTPASGTVCRLGWP